MIFQYDDRTVDINKDRMIFKVGDEILMEKETASLIGYSLSRPFSIDATDWAFESEEERGGTLKLTYRCMPIRAELTFRAGDYALESKVEFMNVSEEKIADFTGGIFISATGHGKNKMTLPHIIYNDNPSAAPENIVPHIGDVVGEGIIVEEHRLPIPGVNAEWTVNGNHHYMTLFLIPDVKTGDEEEYWSLGIIKEEDGEQMAALSGPLMFNGMKDVVYGGRNTPLSWPKGYRYLRPKESLVKKFCLAWGNTEEGKGFRNLVELGYEILNPHAESQHSAKEMIDYKKNVLDTRFYKDEDCCGYQTFGAENSFGNLSGRPEYFLYGWTGQSIKLAWCDCVLGLTTEETFRLQRGMEVADFFVRNGESAIPGLYKGYYLIEQKDWRGVWKDPNANLSSRIEGESMTDLLDIMLLLREYNREVPAHWEDAVRRACAFFMDETYQTRDKIYPMSWGIDGRIGSEQKNAAGMPCVLALAKAAQYFDDKSYLNYAIEKYEIYADLHMKTFEIPFARATMDAKCEDKESGLYFFKTAVLLYYITEEERFKRWAEISGDWILTFIFFWETGFQKDSQCFKENFKTTGWPGVSVQNHHLDVFFPAYEMYAFGKNSGIEKFEKMGLNVRNALTYGVCTYEGEWGFQVIGEQGEHYYHTNYFQVYYPSVLRHMSSWRGGMQNWNPSWITAQVMNSNIRFWLEEQGISK